AGGDEGFAGDACGGVALEGSVQDGVADLVGDLVRMTFRNRLGSEEMAAQPALLWAHGSRRQKVARHARGDKFQRPEKRERSSQREIPAERTSTTSSAVGRVMASAAAARAAAAGTVRTIFLISGSEAGLTLSAVMPRPRSRKTPSGLAASSPQTLTSMPAARPASAVRRSSSRTAGWNGVYSRAIRALLRSTASVYCTRSFVPMEKKSA